MKCEDVFEIVRGCEFGTTPWMEAQEYIAHIADCDDCRSALRASDALQLLKERPIAATPDDVYSDIKAQVLRKVNSTKVERGGFWFGAGIGGAVAAAIFAAALSFGWIDNPGSSEPTIAEFMVAMNEPRRMDIAIETDRPLQGATITLLLAGSIELDGFEGQREISWTEDLDAGTNRLSLPVFASAVGGGQLVVRLDHPQSKQVFVINLRTEA